MYDETQIVPKPCSRCGAGSFDEDYAADARIETALCAEVQMAFGLVAWLCHNCRCDWHKAAKIHPLQIKYSIASLKLDFWRARIGPNTPNEKLDEGLALLADVAQLELQINEFANHWMLD